MDFGGGHADCLATYIRRSVSGGPCFGGGMMTHRTGRTRVYSCAPASHAHYVSPTELQPCCPSSSGVNVPVRREAGSREMRDPRGQRERDKSDGTRCSAWAAVEVGGHVRVRQN